MEAGKDQKLNLILYYKLQGLLIGASQKPLPLQNIMKTYEPKMNKHGRAHISSCIITQIVF